MWFAGLIIWSVSIIRRWQAGGDLLARDIWFYSHFAACFLPMLWKFTAHESYTKHRIVAMATIRCFRVIGIITIIAPNQNFIWKPASGEFGCPLALFVSQYMKLAYLLCQVLAHQVPFIHHVWLITFNALAVLVAIPGRCKAECDISPAMSECSIKMLEKLAVLDKLWIFSASNPASSRHDIQPWQVCAIIQALFGVRPFKFFENFQHREF